MRNRYLVFNGPAKLALVAILYLLTNCQRSEVPRKIEVLFLGHNSEHHHSEAYLPLLASTLTPRGINFTYTADLNDLNSNNLAKYDALALYANYDSIAPDQERALLDFIKGGKGFLPIHCASYCFRNSEEFIKLVGAQFVSHDTATFTADIVLADHPVMKGLDAFQTWDETYVHTLHNEDRTVLMERVEGDRREPWTWVRNYGKGRVFYTAYGHDERTWDNSGFHDLMERGIRWAVGEKRSNALNQLTFAERTYSDAKIPNYEKRDPSPKLQAPLSPEASQTLIQIPPGFKLELFAAEPDISTPISAAWDEKGRLWLLETTDYPNEINVDDNSGNDKITILEDTDNDGKADKFTTFADRLSVPTSLTFHQGGVIVAQAPHFLYLKDTDGDDKADIREIIMTGWGTFDTHAGPSNLRYGFDNWIWGVVGYSAFDGIAGSDSLQFSQGVYRFRPDGSKMELMGSTSNNTWGLGFSETFDIFASTANNTHSAYLGIPNRFFVDVSGITSRTVQKIDGHYSFHPITKNFRQVDVFGGFTAAAGHSLYTARDFPREFWNRVALVCEPTGHLLHQAILEKDGAGFTERDGWNLLASADEWVSPVQAEVGPDGAVWILDWYNFIIQHNPTPPGFENGPGNAHINPLRDKVHGRIYRLSYEGAKPRPPVQLSKGQPAKLVTALRNENMLWRMHAQRLLVERGKLDIAEELYEIVRNRKVDEIGLNSPAVHALWTMHGLKLLDGTNQEALNVAEEALDHPAAGVRKAALQTLPRTKGTMAKLLAAGCHRDPDAHTRLAAITTLAELPTSKELAEVLFHLMEDEQILGDDWLSKAIYTAMIRHKNALIAFINEKDPELLQPELENQAPAVNWLATDLNIDDWPEIPVPQWWREEQLRQMDGVVWCYTEIELTPAEANAKATIHAGRVADDDHTYINGRLVGSTRQKWNTPRIYSVPGGILMAGKNRIAIKVTDTGGGGGIHGPKEEMFLQLGNRSRPLAGNWKFKIESISRQDKSPFEEGATPFTLFLNNYGPYANQVVESLALDNQPSPADQTITIKTVRDQMKYDLEEFTVKAGTTVDIVFENNDAMQHNWLLLQPGSLEIVGKAADVFATKPEAPAKGYVPAVPYVLTSSILIDPGTKTTIRVQVPDEPGEYPYVCTFPGHWRTMNGIMKVVSGQL